MSDSGAQAGPPAGPPGPPGPPMVMEPDFDRGPALMAMFWVESIFCVTILAMRLFARYKIRGLGADDWLMLFTVVLFLIMTAFVTKLALIGGARHVYYLQPPEVLEALKWVWISQPWGIFIFATGKASIGILILRILGDRSVYRKYFLYFVVGSLFVLSSLGVIFTFAQCNPPRALWTPSLMPTAKCWDPSVQEHFNYFLSAFNIFADVVLAVLPVSIIVTLNMRPAKKIAVCFLLSLGLLAAVISGVKIIYLKDLGKRADFTWETYNIVAWTGAEAFVMIMCGNVPPLQVLWDRFVTGKKDSNYGNTPLKYVQSGSGRSGPSYKKNSTNNSSVRHWTDVRSGSEAESVNRDEGVIYQKTDFTVVHSTREMV